MALKDGYVIEYDHSLRKNTNCYDCIYADKSDHSCSKKGYHFPSDGKHFWRKCQYFELDENVSNYEYKVKQTKRNIEEECKIINQNNGCIITPFEGIKKIPLSDIYVSYKDQKKKKSKSEAAKKREFIDTYRETKRIKDTVVVSIIDGLYVLIDKSYVYIAARELGLSYVLAEMGTKMMTKERDIFRTKGTLVWGKKYADVGEVVDSYADTITVRYDSGIIETYDLIKALKTEMIRLL